MGKCSANDVSTNQCFGGSARLATAVRTIRQQDRNVLLLDAGDQFQGTLWYAILKYRPAAEVMTELKYDAMAFGNHEFDDGLEGLVPFVKSITFPIVSSNVNSTGSALDGSYVDTLILNYDTKKVGIIGYTTTSTPQISKPGSEITFLDEISSLQQAVSKLQANGVDIIIALGHSGISKDREICQKVSDVDIVVGGHTNTFLYTGEVPSKEVPEGSYPEVYTNSKKRCLVVTDFAFGKYLGYLRVSFDGNGSVLDWKGNPVLLDNKFAEDAQMRLLLTPYAKKLEGFQKTPVGSTAVTISGLRKACRLRECNLGNMVIDAAVYAYVSKFSSRSNSSYWTESAVGIMNGGGVRELEKDAGQNITLEDLYSVLPFGNTFNLIKLMGSTIRAVFEHSVNQYSETETHGKFLQVSGIRVVYDLSKPNGRRVKLLSLLCSNCTLPKYEQLVDNATYSIIVPSYLKNGGDGYDMIKKYMLYTDLSDNSDIEVVMQYLKVHNPFMTGVEGRISFVGESEYKQFCNFGSRALSSFRLFSIILCIYVLRA